MKRGMSGLTLGRSGGRRTVWKAALERWLASKKPLIMVCIRMASLAVAARAASATAAWADATRLAAAAAMGSAGSGSWGSVALRG